MLRKFENHQDITTVVTQLAPRSISSEDILLSTATNWNAIGIQTAGASSTEVEGKMYFKMTVLTVMVENYVSKAGKPYPKGTQFVVPAK